MMTRRGRWLRRLYQSGFDRRGDRLRSLTAPEGLPPFHVALIRTGFPPIEGRE